MKDLITIAFGIWFGLRMGEILVPSETKQTKKGVTATNNGGDISLEDIPTDE